jgi:hypothetical protein
MNLIPRAIAMQGLGYGVKAVAVKGILPIASGPPPTRAMMAAMGFFMNRV